MSLAFGFQSPSGDIYLSCTLGIRKPHVALDDRRERRGCRPTMGAFLLPIQASPAFRYANRYAK